jgi:hypothetical protein
MYHPVNPLLCGHFPLRPNMGAQSVTGNLNKKNGLSHRGYPFFKKVGFSKKFFQKILEFFMGSDNFFYFSI